MKLEINQNFLITTDNWFVAPDGEQYKSVWGKLTGIYKSEDILGVKPNSRSTNWYITIGDMVIAGCQIHYAIQTDRVNFGPPSIELTHELDVSVKQGGISRIYNANEHI